MENNISCDKCGAENVEGARFCAECGEEIVLKTETAATTCTDCGAENPENSKFCAECGKLLPVDKTQLSSANICASCGYNNSDGSRFCGECGKELPLKNDSTETICPKCGFTNPPGATFCADCGKTLFEKKKTSAHAHRERRMPSMDQVESEVSSIRKRRMPPLEEVKSEAKSKSSGGLGGLLGSKSGLKKGLTQALGEIEEKTQPHLNKLDSSINEMQKKKEESNGYLVCDSCEGYYELQPGESASDFDECSCGGKLTFSKTIN